MRSSGRSEPGVQRQINPAERHPRRAASARVPLGGGSADDDGSAASTSEACKRQHYARPGRVSFGERSTKLSILAAEGFGRLGVEGTNFIDQFATGVVGGSGGSMTKKGVVKGHLLQVVSVTTQVTLLMRVSCFKLQLRDRQDVRRIRGGGDDRPTPMASGWSLDVA